MSGVSVSKERLKEMLQSDQEEREAIIDHTTQIEELRKRLEACESQERVLVDRLDRQAQQIGLAQAWISMLSALSPMRRVRWLLTGR